VDIRSACFNICTCRNILLALLYDMGQFMGKDPSPCGCGRIILSGPKRDVWPDGVGQRIDGSDRLGGVRTGVDAHAAEILSEARLHKGARGWIQRLPLRAQYVMYYWRGDVGCGRVGGLALETQPLLTARFALAAAAAVLAAGAGAL
jgi:hypothetical protein